MPVFTVLTGAPLKPVRVRFRQGAGNGTRVFSSVSRSLHLVLADVDLTVQPIPAL